MPHVILELSNNIEKQNHTQLLTEIHQNLTEMLPTQLESCKSRVIRHEEFLVGDGNINNAFVHLNIEVLSGRTQATLDLVAKKLMTLLQNNFKSLLNIHFSVSIKDLPAVYYKASSI